MKKWIIVLVIVLLIAGWFISGYNRLVTLREQVRTAWAQVETQYQRRADLVPQLVGTVR